MFADREHLDNEWLVVRHSGEIPEIALNSSYHFLTEDKDGPGLELTQNDRDHLKKAAHERFREIVLRDLLSENREKSIYRGVKRSITNWQRFESFCERQQVSPESLKQEVATYFIRFLADSNSDENTCGCSSNLNCTYDELHGFAHQLGIEETVLLDELKCRCLP